MFEGRLPTCWPGDDVEWRLFVGKLSAGFIGTLNGQFSLSVCI
jgi:hypothetical protein